MKNNDDEKNVKENTVSAQREQSKCLICKHYIEGYICKAFDEIPPKIYHGGKHYKKHPLQKREFTFEIVDKFKELYEEFYDEDGNRRPEAGEPAFKYKPPVYF
jgi:hypothetical protein